MSFEAHGELIPTGGGDPIPLIREVLVLGHDASICVAGTIPDRAIGRSLDAEVADVVRLMPLGSQPSSECRRKVGIDDESHGSAAAKTG